MELKYCPFCGGSPKITCLLRGSPYEGWYVQCMNLECEAEIKHPAKKEVVAIEQWNRRAEEKAAEDVERDISNVSVKGINQEEIADFCRDIMEKFGKNAQWTALILLLQMDSKTGKIPEYLKTGLFDGMIDFIENHPAVQKAFTNQDECTTDIMKSAE